MAPRGHRRAVTVIPGGKLIYCACGWTSGEFMHPWDAEQAYQDHLVGAGPVSREQQLAFVERVRRAIAEMSEGVDVHAPP